MATQQPQQQAIGEDYQGYERRQDLNREQQRTQQRRKDQRREGQSGGGDESRENEPSDSERIEKHLRLLVLALLRRDENIHAKAVEKYYAPNSELINPILGLRRGRQEILGLYQFYSRVLRRLSVHVNKIMISNDQSAAMIELTQHVQFVFFPFMTIQFHMYADLTLTDTADGQGKMIARQIDVYSLGGVLRAFPIVRHMYALYLIFMTFLLAPIMSSIVSMFHSVTMYAENIKPDQHDIQVIADPTRTHEYDYSIFS